MTSQESLVSQITWQEIYWSHPLDTTRTLNLLRQWAAQLHAPQIILEARSTKNGVRFLVGSQRRHETALRRDIEQMVPGTIVAADVTGRGHATVARRLTINQPIRPLESHDNEGSTRSILASLAGLRGKELLVVQIVLGPRLAPQLLPGRLPRVDQGIASLALTGIQPERRPPVSKQIQLKQSDHGFAAVIRVGVSATDEARRATLIKRVVSSFGTLLTPGLRLRERREKVQKLNTPVSEWAFFAPAQRLSVTEVGLLSGWPVGAIDVPYPGLPSIHPRQIRPSFTTGDKHRMVAQATAPGATDVTLGDHR
jgi:hypothetical protein